jgi:hypothetical protein
LFDVADTGASQIAAIGFGQVKVGALVVGCWLLVVSWLDE